MNKRIFGALEISLVQLCLLAILFCPSWARGISLLVANNNDAGNGSLRQAVINNAALGGGNTVVFSNVVTGTISLLSGALLVTTNITIVGPGDKILTVSGNNTGRVLNVSNGIVNVSGLTLANGNGNGLAGGGLFQHSGTLFLSRCTISDNVTSSSAGGIAASGIVAIADCTFSRNRSGPLDGGAIFQMAGSLALTNCTFVENTNASRGGALVVFLNTLATIQNCTFYSNSAAFGGGLLNYGNLAISNSTFVGNNAVFGGGIHNTASGTVTVRNTISAGNTATTGRDAYGTYISGGFNLIGAANDGLGWIGLSDQAGSTNAPLPARLGPLQDNGGFTQTLAPLPDSAYIINQGNRGGSTTDQRGFASPVEFPLHADALGGDGSDIGAVEIGVPVLRIDSAASNVVLSWPLYASSYQLQSVANLATTNNWVIVTNTPVSIGANRYVTNSTALGGRAYRLAF